MPATSAVIDLRDSADGWFGSVCGLPNVVRALLALQYAGFESATLVGEAGERAEALFRRHPNARMNVRRAQDVPTADGAGRLVLRVPVVTVIASLRELAARVGDGELELGTELPAGVSGFVAPARTADERRAAARAIR